jgi:hypothetical protein
MTTQEALQSFTNELVDRNAAKLENPEIKDRAGEVREAIETLTDDEQYIQSSLEAIRKLTIFQNELARVDSSGALNANKFHRDLGEIGLNREYDQDEDGKLELTPQDKAPIFFAVSNTNLAQTFS